MIDYGIYKDNPSARSIISGMIIRANKQFNPSLNLQVEQLTGEPSDRDSYDYAGCEKEVINNK